MRTALLITGVGAFVGMSYYVLTTAVVPSMFGADRQTIDERLENKTVHEKASIKGQDIAAVGAKTRAARQNFDIEIVSTTAIDGGVEVMVKAWKNNQPVGFADGTVEIERFLIYNPPILVKDDAGEIVREHISQKDGSTVIERYREDPEEALLQVIEHNLSVMQLHDNRHIIKGKRGNTTSTFFPAAGNNTPFDGGVIRNATISNWATIINMNGNAGQTTGSTGLDAWVISHGTSNNWAYLGRAILGFSTASIPDTDTVSAATFSWFGSSVNGGKQDNFGLSLAIVTASPSSTSQHSTADFQNAFGSTRLNTSDMAVASWSNIAYNDFALNATGLAAINKTGNTFLGVMFDKDLDAVAPTWASSRSGGVDTYYADQTGTTNDPKLVVQHAAGGGGGAPPKVPDILIFD